MKKIFILTGEPSGDKLASSVISKLKVLNSEKTKSKTYDYCIGCNNYEPNDSCYTYPSIYDCSNSDILTYNLPGNILFNGELFIIEISELFL